MKKLCSRLCSEHDQKCFKIREFEKKILLMLIISSTDQWNLLQQGTILLLCSFLKYHIIGSIIFHLQNIPTLREFTILHLVIFFAVYFARTDFCLCNFPRFARFGLRTCFFNTFIPYMKFPKQKCLPEYSCQV